ncbi:MAG: hypothetical protein ABSF79_10735 [Smithellaceae bacterium]|jgi:hypothetical protein
MKQIFHKSAPAHSILFLFFIFFFFYPQLVSAHSPENVQLEYDSSSQTLKVTITHNTSSPKTHFVKSVIIKKNGSILSRNEYDSQPARDTFTYVYDVSSYIYDVSPQDGDTFEVTANCSISGDTTGTLIIKKEE